MQHWNALNSFQNVLTISADDVFGKSTLLFRQGGKSRCSTTTSIASRSAPSNLSLTTSWMSSITHNAQAAIAYWCSIFVLHLHQFHQTAAPNDIVTTLSPLLLSLSSSPLDSSYVQGNSLKMTSSTSSFPMSPSFNPKITLPSAIKLLSVVRTPKRFELLRNSCDLSIACVVLQERKKILSITGRLALQKQRALRAGKTEQRRIYRHFQNLLPSMS
jgi:hypothetical protein